MAIYNKKNNNYQAAIKNHLENKKKVMRVPDLKINNMFNAP